MVQSSIFGYRGHIVGIALVLFAVAAVILVVGGRARAGGPPAGQGQNVRNNPNPINPANHHNYVEAPVTPIGDPNEVVPFTADPPHPWCVPIPGEPNSWYCDGPPSKRLPELPMTEDEHRQLKQADEWTDIYIKHLPELASVQGFVGGGPSGDGILIQAEEPHGTFPLSLDGVPVTVIPVIQAWDLTHPLPNNK